VRRPVFDGFGFAFSKEEDFMGGDTLKLWIGFTTHSSVEIFCNFIEQEIRAPRYSYNNAAQTVETTSGIPHLIANERGSDKFVTKTGTVCWTT
jgi:hypothetical protein